MEPLGSIGSIPPKAAGFSHPTAGKTVMLLSAELIENLPRKRAFCFRPPMGQLSGREHVEMWVSAPSLQGGCGVGGSGLLTVAVPVPVPVPIPIPVPVPLPGLVPVPVPVPVPGSPGCPQSCRGCRQVPGSGLQRSCGV